MLFCGLTVVTCSGSDETDDGGAPPPWADQLDVKQVAATTVGALDIFSSTMLDVSWSGSSSSVDHYEITLIDPFTSKSTTTTAASTDTSSRLTGLKAGTTYQVAIAACADPDCTSSEPGAAADEGTTSEEYWQLRGSGNSYEQAEQIVADGQVLSYVLQYPAGDSDAETNLKLYFAERPMAQDSGAVAVATNTVDKALPGASFSPWATATGGLRRACDLMHSDGCDSNTLIISAAQAVPLCSPEKVRLFFEASDFADPDLSTRIYYLDSHDGWEGLDFNPNAAKVECGGDASVDYSPGGDCEPIVAIGLEGDSVAGETGLRQARQFKIGFPKRDSWCWDQAIGSFMVITGASTPAGVNDGLFYAVWDGSAWKVEMESDGSTPRVLHKSSHGPVLVHLGASRYKLYYEDRAAGNSRGPGGSGKPLRMVYADGAGSGDQTAVDFDDWENTDHGREVHFLWPDGSLVDAEAESGLGDHFIWVPADDLSTQIMHHNLGGMDSADWKAASYGLGISVLLNP